MITTPMAMKTSGTNQWPYRSMTGSLGRSRLSRPIRVGVIPGIDAIACRRLPPSPILELWLAQTLWERT
jgi:hypothetical protein